MALLNGSIFSLGFRVALKGDNDPVMPPTAAQVPRYLHLVDGSGNTVVPVLVADGLTTPEGPISGLKWTLDFASNAALATLSSQVNGLETEVNNILNPQIAPAQWQASVSPDFSVTRHIKYSGNPAAVTMVIGEPLGIANGQTYTVIIENGGGETNSWDPTYWQLGVSVGNAITQTIDPLYSGSGVLISQWIAYGGKMYPMGIYNGAV
jgi:hypothetical protein